MIETLLAVVSSSDHIRVPLAYIDPGSGSLIIQALIGGVLAGVFFFRSKIAAIGDWVRSKRSPKPKD